MAALLMVACAWGVTFPLGKYIIERMPVYSYLTMRFLIASALLLPFARRDLRRAKAADVKVSILIGLMLFIAFAFQSQGLAHTTAAKSSFANGLYVILTPLLFSALFRAPLRKPAIIAGVLATLGTALLGGDFSGLHGWDLGVTLTVISTVFTALQIVALARYAVLIKATVLTFIQTSTVALGCLGLSLATETWTWDVGLFIWASIIFLAVFATVLAYFVQCRAQRQIDHTATAVIMSMECVFGALLAWIFLDETIGPALLVGCALLFAAMIIAQLGAAAPGRGETDRR